jgi:hypothetical protein
MDTILTYFITTAGVSAFFFMWLWYVAEDKWCVQASLNCLFTAAILMLIAEIIRHA